MKIDLRMTERIKSSHPIIPVPMTKVLLMEMRKLFGATRVNNSTTAGDDLEAGVTTFARRGVLGGARSASLAAISRLNIDSGISLRRTLRA